jgi:hypothetical protein
VCGIAELRSLVIAVLHCLLKFLVVHIAMYCFDICVYLRLLFSPRDVYAVLDLLFSVVEWIHDEFDMGRLMVWRALLFAFRGPFIHW